MKDGLILNRTVNLLCVIFLFLAIIYIRYNYDSSEIADYDAYAYFTDVYWSGFDRTWIISEPFGWGALLALRALTGSTHGAIVVAHWLLGIFTCGAILAVAFRYRLKWQGVMLSIAMFGPLLSMVTIRATPAYLLCVAATLVVSNRRFLGVGMVAIAALFHNTALLALGPILIIIAQQVFPKISSPFQNKILIVVLSSMIGTLFLLFRQDLFGLLQDAISSAPGFMQKYVVYFTSGGLESAINASRENVSIFHILFIVGATLIFILYIMLSEEEQKPYRVFAVASFAIFIMLSTNPVISYRQSIFWLIPILLTFPWERLRPGPLASIGVIAFSLVVFPLNVDGVILKWQVPT
ncbi:hypothetical protein [Sphingopyxis alaskensis]|uniref:hypothetical protein n=1 Tax=Sphingopyxis alaskensis TaxID=117207 RepID=UPI00391BD21E